MKTETATIENLQLRALLRECKVAKTLPPRFQEGVWRRIARQEEEPSGVAGLWFACVRWIDTVLPRPALAASYVAVLLVIGASAGWTQARQEKARVSVELSSRYVQSVDPYQANR